ncbi:hypothetical protein LAJ19_13320 [Deinococcus taeanensis]|uniref:hypothetical protein n=1 Tax=Deinococcus taeanensis TaxID=2737050 RepID=UPI001CDB6CA9|nr:hypothetical protein [Deinococcus taeanensis]UBV42589.1 hypothetical protein LAJ19_13320 [Deinococcus taeanensis]
MKRGLLLSLLLCTAPVHAQTPDLLTGGDYARAFDSAQADGDPLTASRAAAAMAEYRAGGRGWITRAVSAARQAVTTRPTSPDTHLALGSALGLQARAGGFTLGALNSAQQARAALDRADIQAVLAEWHAGAWTKAGVFSGGNASRARTLAAAARHAPDNLFVQAHAGLGLALLRDPQARLLLNRAAALEARTALDRDLQAQARRALRELH